MRLALLSGAFPPQFDGIGDYSWWLSQTLAQQGHEVTVLTSFAPVRQPVAGVDVIPCFDASRSQTIHEALQSLRKKGRFDWLIVQYNPFCFGRRGFAPWLIPALRGGGIPVAVMFHETFAVPLWPWQQIVMRIWQYPQFALLARTGRCHFVSTERWLAQVRRWAKGPSQLLPVGSNLPLCDLTKREAREKLGLSPDALILGVFGFAHQSKRTAWIGAAARSIHHRFPQTEVLCIGQVGQLVRNVCGKTPVHDHGFLPGPEVSLRLRAMDLFLAPLTDGISGRRGSVVAALQHGLPICSTVRNYTDTYLKNLVSPAFSLVPHDNQ
ncbi:MAG: glycosyltransferase family 4 protein, partial [Candidatus Eremiobacteraeota bacterium]|nr:glycosyltransferase family 4 protein [Candidatus Eremiobacteraeota bacterium]